MEQQGVRGWPGRVRAERLTADLSLLLVAAIWGTAFVALRVAVNHLGPFLNNGLRFSLAALTLLPFAWRGSRARPRLTPRQWRGALLAGLVLFAASGIQQLGLRYTTAGKAGFITGLYVLLVPPLLAIGWRQRIRGTMWAGSALAAAGLYLLSGAGGESVALNAGDALVLASALFWALHVIVIGQAAPIMPVLALAVIQYAVCGALSAGVGLALEGHTLGGLANAWWAVLYTGVISVAIGYTLQVAGQRHAPAADAAVLLSLEAVFAALFGWLFLGELLAPIQLAGCGLMLAAMLLAQF
jgi:drug/metabolite transporter (DMT)-like permease